MLLGIFLAGSFAAAIWAGVVALGGAVAILGAGNDVHGFVADGHL